MKDTFVIIVVFETYLNFAVVKCKWIYKMQRYNAYEIIYTRF